MLKDLILLLQELVDLPDQVSNLVADPLVAKILKHPALTKANKAQLLSALDRENGWLFAGLDFASLEDRISALTTKDPNKLKIYIGVSQYELSVNSIVHQIRGDQVLRYDGQELTGDQLYEKLQSSKL